MKKVILIIFLFFISVCTYYFAYYKPQQHKKVLKENIYLAFYGDKEQVYKWCYDELIKPEQKASVVETIKNDYICECAIDKNKKAFLSSISDKNIKDYMEKGIDNLQNMSQKTKIKMIGVFFPICYADMEQKGLEYFKKKYDKE